MTQDELAKKCDVDKTAISHWENGSRPQVGHLPALAAALETTVAALIEGDAAYAKILAVFGAA